MNVHAGPERKPDLTDSQRSAVTAGERDLWLTAGAGSGKTLVLAERYLHLHLKRNVPIRKILAITFTEKAAAEMGERIAASLQERGEAKALREMPHAPILTIDSLCYRLLREYGEAAGLDPTVDVIDPREAAEWQERVWSALLDEWWGGRRDDLLLLLRALAWRVDAEKPGGVDPAPLFALVRAVRTAGRRIEQVPFLPGLDGPRRQLLTRLERLIAEVESLFGEKITERTEEMLRAIVSLGDKRTGGEERSAEFRRVRSLLKRNVSRVAKGVVGEAIVLLDRWTAVDDEESLGEARRLLGELAVRFHREYTSEKERAGVADFLDLEESALAILEKEEVRREIRSRFAWLLLDECQDTNELQLRIVGLLRNRGRFLAVGDAKQSIYAFRDADVTAFVEMDERLGEGASRIVLEENFRSRREILDWVNALFPRIWEENASMRVPYEELLFGDPDGEKFRPKEEPSIEMIVVRGGKSAHAREREADLLARRLRAIHEARLDGLQYGDMAILFRSTADLRTYERRLRYEGVPASVAMGRGFFQTREVTDLLGALSLVDDPYDDLRLAAALRSPLAGVADEDLALLLVGREGADRSLWARITGGENAATLSPEGEETVRRFTALLERLRSLRGRTPAFRLLERLVRETGYVESHLLLPDGLRLRANIRKLLEIARELDRSAELSLPASIRRLRDFRYTHLREAESALDAERDAVRLLTIHGAKGMQFPLVAVVDLGRARPPDRSVVIYHKEEGVGVQPRSDGARKKNGPYLFEKIREKKRALDEAERNRLLYVAMTRAERHLILSGSMDEKPKEWLKQIVETMEIPGEPCVHEKDRVRVLVLGDEAPAGRKEKSFTPEEVLRSPERFAAKADDALCRSLCARMSAPPPAAAPDEAGRTVTAVKSFSDCPRRYFLSRAFPLPDLSHADGGGEGSGVGTAFHRMMEDHWRGGVATADPAAELARWRDLLLANPRMEPFLSASKREAEVSFSVPAAGRELRGIIDLLAWTGDHWMILDYKTDKADGEEIVRRYTVSLNLYRLAIRSIIGGRAPVEAWIHSAREGLLLPVPEGEEGALAALRRFDHAEEESEWPPKKNEWCRVCSYRFDCPAI